MNPIERIEAAMAELREHPDRVIHHLYLGYALHDCQGLAEMPAAKREELLHAVSLNCHTILCPPLAVGANSDDVYLLVQQNPERSMDAIAQAAGVALGRQPSGELLWSGNYSAVSLGQEDAEELVPHFLAGDERVHELFLECEEEE